MEQPRNSGIDRITFCKYLSHIVRKPRIEFPRTIYPLMTSGKLEEHTFADDDY